MRAPSNTPPGQRSSVVGRSLRANRMPGPTATKYSTTSILRMPRSAKYGFSGLETRTSWPSISRTTASLLLAMGVLSEWITGRGVSRRAGEAVHRRGEIDEVRVDRAADAVRLRIGRVPLSLPREQDPGLEVRGHVHGAGERGHRVTGVAHHEDRRAALGVPLGDRRPLRLPHRAGVEPDRGPGTEQRVLRVPLLGEVADLALLEGLLAVGAVHRDVGVVQVGVRAVLQPSRVAVGEGEQ